VKNIIFYSHCWSIL